LKNDVNVPVIRIPSRKIRMFLGLPYPHIFEMIFADWFILFRVQPLRVWSVRGIVHHSGQRAAAHGLTPGISNHGGFTLGADIHQVSVTMEVSH
jgi:hypothetical protein